MYCMLYMYDLLEVVAYPLSFQYSMHVTFTQYMALYIIICFCILP